MPDRRRPSLEDHPFIDLPHTARHRRVAVLADVAIKHDTADRIRLEVLKTTIAGDVSRRTTSFRVPTILSHDIDSGRITFERLTEVRPLREVLLDGTNPASIMRRLGAILATIHATVTPADFPLSAPPLVDDPRGSLVFIHGDFGIDNIFYNVRRDEIVITDWSVPDWLAVTDGANSCYIDLSMMLISLLVARMLAPGHIRRAAVLASVFIHGYVSNAAQDCSSQMFKRYFSMMLWIYIKARWRIVTFPAFLARCPSFARAWIVACHMNLKRH